MVMVGKYIKQASVFIPPKERYLHVATALRCNVLWMNSEIRKNHYIT